MNDLRALTAAMNRGMTEEETHNYQMSDSVWITITDSQYSHKRFYKSTNK